MSTAYQPLVAELASQAQNLRFCVNGTSMLPLFKDGDSILVQAVPIDTLRPGDLISFRREKDIVTHRLVGVTPQQYLTIGDNMVHLDPPVAPEMILGRVVAIEKNDRYWPILERRWATSALVWLGQQKVLVSPARGGTSVFRAINWLMRRLIQTFLFIGQQKHDSSTQP